MARPTLSEVNTRLLGAVRLYLGLTSSVARSVLQAICTAIAGSLYLVYVYADNLFANFFPQDASGDRLDKWGTILGLGRTPATFAVPTLTFRGTTGSVVPAGTILSSEDGKTFTTDSELALTGETGTVSATATVAGADSNFPTGTPLRLTQAITGIGGSADITSTGTIGLSAESDVLYKRRVISFFHRDTFKAGSFRDYEQWVADISPDYKVWIRKADNYEVFIYCLKRLDNTVPTNDELNALKRSLYLESPVTANLQVVSPHIQTVDFNIEIFPNTTEISSQIEQNIRALFDEYASVRGAFNITGESYTGLMPYSKIIEALGNIPGLQNTNILSPTQSLSPNATGDILSPNNFTFSTYGQGGFSIIGSIA